MRIRKCNGKRKSGYGFLASVFAAAIFVPPLSAQTTKPADPKCKPGSKQASCQDVGTPSGQDSSQKPPATAFPFPTEDSRHGGDAEAPAAPQNGLPAMPTGDVPDPPASSERPMKLPPGAGSSSSSSGDDAPPATPGSSSSRSSEDDNVAPTSAPSDAPIKSSALKDLGSRGDMSAARLKLEQTRVADDMKVGSFYLKDGNTQGAYLRFKDAVDHAPDEPDPRFSLAETAARLNKRDEASLNYREYLRLDPGGDHDKAARKALGKLGVTAP
ncbi:MAG: tetratricopeptide repeat protein [Janthinobacterium lividum]